MPILAAIGLARKVAEHPTTTVLLHGETGTGKELFSRGIHYAGTHATEPFVAVNCSAIPEHLVESELFGHERGAFTDARVRKVGLLELAGSGTLFLDEIEELPLQLQPKLLRVLEDRFVRRLGGVEEYAVNCRLIAASNVDLSIAVAAGQFRQDLFYRFNVFRIELPPLRMRPGDVDLLARTFVASLSREHGLAEKHISAEAMNVLRAHPWPGNIRELKNTIERAVIVSDDNTIEPHHILIQRRSTIPGTVDQLQQLAGTIEVPVTGMSIGEAERQLIDLTLRITGSNHTHAARLLGITRPTLLSKIRQYGLEATD